MIIGACRILRCASFNIMLIMKVIFKALVVLVSASLVFSCGRSKNRTVDYADTLTAADTASVIALSDAFLDRVVSGDIQGALSSVGYIDWDEETFSPLTSEMYAIAKKQYEDMSLKRFERTKYEFVSPNENFVYYRVYFGSDEENVQLSSNVAFNAVKIDGKWYLAMK